MTRACLKRDSDATTVDLNKQEAEQADIDARAKRVIEVDSNGTTISAAGRTKKYEDTDFVSGESPVTHDVNTDLSKNAVDGYLICDGPGNILLEFSDDGSNYGDQHTIKKREVVDLLNLNIDSIRIAHSGTDSAYRILVL